ncbi:MAG: hypothetical protein IJ144_04545 [Prevotella sp.]|nr:hypothetical protein [Prevotella sp.]
MKQNILRNLLVAASLAATGSALADSFTVEPFTIAAGEEKVVTLHLDGTRKYIGFQVDVYLPEGVSIKEDADGLYLDVVAAMTNNRNGHTAEGNLNGDHYTIIVDHPRNGEFQSASGDVLDMTLVASDQISTGRQQIVLKRQILNDAAINEYRFDDAELPFDTEIDVTVSDLGYATFSWPRDLDFTNAGVQAFIATEANDNLLLQPVEKVPAGTGIVLKGDAGTYNPQTIDEATDDVSGNLLTGTASASYTVEGTNTYVLSKNSDDTPGFRRAAEGLEIAKYKAYLTLTDGLARSFFGFADNTTTGITYTQRSAGDAQVFDLSGRRVQQPGRGLYIMDGKVVVVK